VGAAEVLLPGTTDGGVFGSGNDGLDNPVAAAVLPDTVVLEANGANAIPLIRRLFATTSPPTRWQ
jgi:hypothetical protein